MNIWQSLRSAGNGEESASGGALQLRDIAQQVERDCKAGHGEAASAHIPELRARFNEVLPLWQAYLDIPAT